MDVFSMELGILLSFVNASELQGGFETPNHPPQYTTVSKQLVHGPITRVLSQINPTHILPSCFFKIHLSCTSLLLA
jgi:hypothetical protein